MRKKSNHSNGHSGGHSNGRNSGRSRKFRSGGGGGGGGNDSQSLARQKKTAMTQKEKYLNMARDALSNGDRVEAEYYFQHVEHYSRVIGEIIAKEPPSMRERTDTADTNEHADDEATQTEPRAGNDNSSDDHADDEEEIPLPASLLSDDLSAAN